MWDLIVPVAEHCLSFYLANQIYDTLKYHLVTLTLEKGSSSLVSYSSLINI